MRRCLFCDTALKRGARYAGLPEQKAKEHIMPAWLLKHLGIEETGTGIQLIAMTPGAKPGGVALNADMAEQLKAAQKGPLRRFTGASHQNGSVCYGCNGGWMNSLETAVRPILKPLIDGTKTVEELTSDEGATLCRWSLKTAFVACQATKSGSPVPLEHVLLVKKGQLPSGVALFGTNSPTALPTRTWCDHKWYVWLPESRGLESERSYKATFQFGRVVFTAAFWPTELPIRFATKPGLHHPIWPGELETVEIPTPSPVRPGVSLYLQSHFSLGVTQSDPLPVAWTVYRGQLVYQHEAFLMEVVQRNAALFMLCPCESGLSFGACHGTQTS
jgi:ethanolamine utilization microcompartment shell protein EutS